MQNSYCDHRNFDCYDYDITKGGLTKWSNLNILLKMSLSMFLFLLHLRTFFYRGPFPGGRRSPFHLMIQ